LVSDAVQSLARPLARRQAGLLLVYIGLGSFALKRVLTQTAKAAFFVAALS